LVVIKPNIDLQVGKASGSDVSIPMSILAQLILEGLGDKLNFQPLYLKVRDVLRIISIGMLNR
jgi:hypothetical protein